jgi:hypothetical protein
MLMMMIVLVWLMLGRWTLEDDVSASKDDTR